MIQSQRHRKNGFTLVEILIAVVILAITAALVIPRLLGQVEKAKEAEASLNLGSIRSAELLLHSLSGKFVAAEGEAGIKEALGLMIKGHFYTYKIVDVTDDDFLALATPVGLFENWLREIGMNKDGFVGYNPGTGGGSSGGGSSGGSSGGGSGGSSGGPGDGFGGGSGGSGGAILGGSISDVGSVKDAALKKPFEGWAADMKVAMDTLALSTAALSSSGAGSGKALADFMTKYSIDAKFVPDSEMPDDCKGALGCQDPQSDGTSVLYILDKYKGNKYAAAAILGHEALHAVWWMDWYEYDTKKKSQPTVGMPIPGGGIRSSSSEDQEYNTKKAGGEIWHDLEAKFGDAVIDDGDLWTQPAADERNFVGVDEDVAKGYLKSKYHYNFAHKY